MIRRIILCCLAVLLITTGVLPLLAQAPQPFSADMKLTGKGVSSTGKLFSSGDKVRMEMTAMGRSSITIADNVKKMAWVLMPDQKMYMEMSTENAQKKGPGYRNYNPANPCEGLANTTCQKVGTETVNGELCDKWVFTSKGNGPNLTTWISKANGIPIKSVTADGATMELSNIKFGAQSASLFEVPAGYQKFDIGNVGNMMKGLGKVAQ